MTRLLIILFIATAAHAQVAMTQVTIPKLIDFDKVEFEAQAGVESYFYDQTNDNDQNLNLVIPDAALTYNHDSKLSLNISGIYEDDTAELENLNASYRFNSLLALTIGKQVLSLDSESSLMISDPFLLSLSEIKETMAKLEVDFSFIHAEIAGFNGSTDRRGENDSIKSWLAKISLQAEHGFWKGKVGYSYLNNLADSGELNSYFQGSPLHRIVAAHHFHTSAAFKNSELSADYLISADDFRAEDLAGQSTFLGTFSLQFNQSFFDRFHLGVNYQRNYGGMYLLDLPKERYSLSSSFNLSKHTLLNLEFYQAQDFTEIYYDDWGSRKTKSRKHLGALAQFLITV